MLGGFLALLSAASFALNVTALRRGVLTASVFQAIAITVPMGVPLFLLILLLFDCWDVLLNLSTNSIIFFSIAGILHFVFGRYSNYRSTQALGATQAGPITQLALFVSIFFAFFVLDENITIYLLIGMVMVLLGPTVILLAKKKNTITQSGITIDYKNGYKWGVLCALCFGSSPFFVKLGLDDGGIKENIAGGFVSYIAATIFVFLILLLSRSNLKDIYSMNNSGAKWFIVTGLLVFLSQLLRYMALGVAPVSVVEPIQRTTVIFRVVFSWLLNKQHEIINLTVLLGILLSIIGVYLIIWQI